MRPIASVPALCVALACVATSALANDLVVNEGNDSIRLSEAACSSQAILQRIEPKAHTHFRTASATLQGQRYTACWSIVSTAVLLVYEDGDQGLVPVSKLKVPVDI